MKRHVSIRKILLQTAALVFLLNTVAAYGACCFVTLDTDKAVAELPPCHQTAGAGTSENQDDGCLMCISMLPSPDLTALAIHAAPAIATPAMTTLVTTGIDPPFRPPISYLS